MKKNRSLLLGIVLVLTSGTLFAQQQRLGVQSPEERTKMQVERVSEGLTLTAEQTAALTKYFSENAQNRQSMRDATPEQRTEMRKKMEESIKEILTPEQFEIWMKKDAERRANQPTRQR